MSKTTNKFSPEVRERAVQQAVGPAADAGADMPAEHPRIADIAMQNQEPLSGCGFMHHVISNICG